METDVKLQLTTHDAPSVPQVKRTSVGAIITILFISYLKIEEEFFLIHYI